MDSQYESDGLNVEDVDCTDLAGVSQAFYYGDDCRLTIDAVDPALHYGEWKCLLEGSDLFSGEDYKLEGVRTLMDQPSDLYVDFQNIYGQYALNVGRSSYFE